MFNGNYTYYRDTLKGEHAEDEDDEEPAAVVVREAPMPSRKKVSVKEKKGIRTA